MGDIVAFPKHLVSRTLGFTQPLPAFWDGTPITWRPFEYEKLNRVWICQRRCMTGRNTCPGCGETDAPCWVSKGFNEIGVLELIAHRCDYCGHDSVLEVFHDLRSWDLDESDYGPHGSVAPIEVSTGALF